MSRGEPFLRPEQIGFQTAGPSEQVLFQHLAGVQKVFMGWSNRDTDSRGTGARGGMTSPRPR